MSRFYQVLKEASRDRQNTSGEAAEGDWGASGITDIELPVLNDIGVSEAAAPAAVLADQPRAASPEEVLHSVIRPRNGSIGTQAKVVLDQKARLIPHAVDPVVVEHYRTLRTKILQQQSQKTFRSLVVTSPSPQEGKTVTVLNLGFCFAMLPSFKILVVDGDLRRGSLGNWLGMDNTAGLSNLIDGSAKLEDVVWKSDENSMNFILRGNSTVPPGELLQSSHLQGHLRRMTELFDLVLVDSPPVNLITDVQLLAANCDAVLLIARAFSTTRKAFEKAVQELLPFRVIGTVLNAGAAQANRKYRGYY
jgi:capsular exopolysaccharide synthesis family protein